MRYRIISTGNTVVADAAFMDEHHGGDYELLADAPQATPIKRVLTRLAFRNRFTPAEKVALYTAAESSVQIKIYLDDLAAATFVDPERPDTIAGVQALEAATIIGPGRAAEILTAPVTDEEMWVG